MANLVKAYEAAIGKDLTDTEIAEKKNALAEISLAEHQRRLRREAWLDHEFTKEFLNVLAANRSEALKNAEQMSYCGGERFIDIKNLLHEAKILTKVINYANTGNY